MRKLIRLSLVVGLPYGSYTYYKNHFVTPPPSALIHEKKDKKIVVIGAGIVGLSTAYFLSQYENTQVVLVEKNMKCAMECSIQNGNLMMRYNAAPWTYKPIIDVLKGLWRSDQGQAIYPTKALKEPGTFKFAYYWLLLNDKMNQTIAILKLNEATEALYDRLLQETGITPESVNYDKTTKYLQFKMLEGIDIKKSYDAFMKTYSPYAELLHETTELGQENLISKFAQHFPKYKGQQKYNFALIQPIYTMNTRVFCERLDDHLKSKVQNLKMLYGHEVESFIFNENPNQKHLVKGIKIKGQEGVIECDAVVVCAGPFLARLLKQHFGLICPVMPIKGYSFDIPTDTPVSGYHLGFKDKSFVATHYQPDKIRIAAFGDASGLDKSYDPRRLRYLKNLVSEFMDANECHNYQSLSTCLRPTTPDDTPIVGSLKFYPNVFINGGHSGRGTTIGLSTSKLISELLMEGKTRTIEDITPYSPRRFQL